MPVCPCPRRSDGSPLGCECNLLRCGVSGPAIQHALAPAFKSVRRKHARPNAPFTWRVAFFGAGFVDAREDLRGFMVFQKESNMKRSASMTGNENKKQKPAEPIELESMDTSQTMIYAAARRRRVAHAHARPRPNAQVE